MPDDSPVSTNPRTLCIHGDTGVEDTPDVAPPMHLSTTFATGNAEGLVYARDTTQTRQRLETLLGALEGGHAVVYASGQAAAHAAMRHLRPRRVAIDRGYHGTHRVLDMLKAEGVEVCGLDAPPQTGDLRWVESPKNPTCELHDIVAMASEARRAGAHLVVDGTFAPPVIQKPLALGAHMVMHSATKFLGGHSDLLCGVLAVPDAETAEALRRERSIMGAIPGALECWLLLRSLRTLDLRVHAQCESAAKIAQAMEARVGRGLQRVWHPSLPSHPQHDLATRQMAMGGGVLAIELESKEAARALPGKLRLFTEATSLGGVESLIEWRHQYDPQTPPGLLRISVGLEDTRDLIADLEQGLHAIHA